MPRPKIRRKKQAAPKVKKERRSGIERRATEHRLLVLEAVATSPVSATRESILKDCVGHGFTAHMVDSMLWQLRKEGLIGEMTQGVDVTYFLTHAGFQYLTGARFDVALPEQGRARPGARKPRGKKGEPK